MKKILFVEDSELIARVYGRSLADAGFDVVVAEDGLAAMKKLQEFKPDLVVLDLAMPKFSGADVLKFMRQNPAFKSTRVIVFSNTFLSNLVEQVAALHPDKVFVKADVNPAGLITGIREVLGEPVLEPSPKPMPAAPPPVTQPGPPGKTAFGLPPFARLGRDFMERVPHVLKELRQLSHTFLETPDALAQAEQLTALSQKISFLSQVAGMAGYSRTAELCSAFQALLFELTAKPVGITDSTRHTVVATVAFLINRFDQLGAKEEAANVPAAVLLVDDDAVSNLALVRTLSRLQLTANSMEDPFAALNHLRQTSYDAVILDINMRGMDGLALCEQMRGLVRHKQTPVIFVTGLTDFKTRARSILSGGDDLVTKPISPIEVCVKVLTRLLQTA